MIIGRTSSGSIKIKTDEAGGGLRAVNCTCCGGGDCSPAAVTLWLVRCSHSIEGVVHDGQVYRSATSAGLSETYDLYRKYCRTVNGITDPAVIYADPVTVGEAKAIVDEGITKINPVLLPPGSFTESYFDAEGEQFWLPTGPVQIGYNNGSAVVQVASTAVDETDGGGQVAATREVFYAKFASATTYYLDGVAHSAAAGDLITISPDYGEQIDFSLQCIFPSGVTAYDNTDITHDTKTSSTTYHCTYTTTTKVLSVSGSGSLNGTQATVSGARTETIPSVLPFGCQSAGPRTYTDQLVYDPEDSAGEFPGSDSLQFDCAELTTDYGPYFNCSESTDPDTGATTRTASYSRNGISYTKTLTTTVTESFEDQDGGTVTTSGDFNFSYMASFAVLAVTSAHVVSGSAVETVTDQSQRAVVDITFEACGTAEQPADYVLHKYIVTERGTLLDADGYGCLGDKIEITYEKTDHTATNTKEITESVTIGESAPTGSNNYVSSAVYYFVESKNHGVCDFGDFNSDTGGDLPPDGII